MKKVLRVIVCICIVLVIVLPIVTFATNEGTTLYVAPDGSDSSEGTEAAPLATMTGARDKVRELKRSSGLPRGGITVYFRGGKYNVTETTAFTAEDSGTPNSPIIYKAYPGETPVFTGGQYVDGKDFSTVTDAGQLARLTTASAKQNVVSYNLFENGITYSDLDYGKEFWEYGSLSAFPGKGYFDDVPRRMQVYIDDDALHLARYPNKTQGAFEENPYDVYLAVPSASTRAVLGVSGDEQAATPAPANNAPTPATLGTSGAELDAKDGVVPLGASGASTRGAKAVFSTNEARIKTWKSYEDIVVFGMLGIDFHYEKIVVENIDPVQMKVALKAKPLYGVTSGSRYGFENVFEELDAPGEYYIDKNTGILYIYPLKDISSAQVKISVLDIDLMVECVNTSHVTFSGLTFELTKGSVFSIKGGDSCVIDSCTLKNFSTKGVKLGDMTSSTRDLISDYSSVGGLPYFINEYPASGNGYNHKVINSTFLNTGFTACVIQSGNVASRESGNMLFENNTVKHSGLLGSAYNSGLNLSGVGITIKNNDFFFCRGQAIYADIIDTQIIYNEFCDSPSDMAEDTGTIYLNYLCMNDGVKIRYNYFHDITDLDPRIGLGWYGYAARTAIYYDTNTPFRDFSYNVVYNVPRVQNIEVISPTTSINNVFIDCKETMTQMDSICEAYETYAPSELLQGINTDYRGEIRIVSDIYKQGIHNTPVWKEKYPELGEYIRYLENGKADLTRPMDKVYDNLIININEPPVDQELRLPENIEVDPKYGKVENNIYLEFDPGFASFFGGDFQLSQEIANRYNVERIDMSLIGAKATKVDGNGGTTDPTEIAPKPKPPIIGESGTDVGNETGNGNESGNGNEFGSTNSAGRVERSGSGGGSARGNERVDIDSTQTLAPTSVSTKIYWIDSQAAKKSLSLSKENNTDALKIAYSGIIGLHKEGAEVFGGTPINIDTVVDRKVEVRVTIPDPSKITRDILVSGSVSSKESGEVKASFEKRYNNKVFVVSMNEQGSWGQPVSISAKIELTETDINNLHFYSYDGETNKYARMKNAEYRVDSNGYLVFATEHGGNIIVSEGVLIER